MRVPALERLQSSASADMPWHLSADNLISLNDGIIFEARGDVLLTRGNDFLQADFARFYTSTNWIFIKGNVQVKLGQDKLTASEAEFDLLSNTGWLKDGFVFMDGPHIYFAGEHVTKHWGDSYTFHNAKITTCDGPVPAWSLTAQDATVEIDGYATLSHTRFQIMNKSVMSAPFMILPAKTTRQSGLLQPDAGVSNLHGFYYTQPWFWKISESRDMTFSMTWMEKTGFMPAIEYRSHPLDLHKTWLGLNYIYDDDTVFLDEDDRIDASDGLLRTNTHRYWLRGMGEGSVGSSEFRYAYTLDHVSDQNFLREFQNRMTGFDDTREMLTDLFGRDLAEVDKNRVSEGYFFRDWDRFRLTLGGRYEQNPAFGHGNASVQQDTTPQKLPEFSAFWFKSRLLPDLPLELEAEATSAFIHRHTGASGFRTEIYPRLSLPLDLKYSTVMLTGGVRQTFYQNTKSRGASPLHDGTLPDEQFGSGRTVPEIGMTAFTQGSRIWELSPKTVLSPAPENIGQSQWTGIRHIIQPRLEYTWLPNIDQSRNPFYFLNDRILPTNSVYFSLNNLFTVRTRKVEAAGEPDQNGRPLSAVLTPDYFEMLRFRVGGGYDFEEASRTRHADVYPRRPIMDIMADANLRLSPWLDFWAQAYFSMYGDGVTRSDQGLTLSYPNWGAWSVGYSTRSKYYDYMRQVKYDDFNNIRFEEPLNLLSNEFNLRLGSKWNIGYYSNLNLDTGDLYETRISLSFLHQCYRLTGKFISKGRERSYVFGIELLGLS